MNKLTRNLAAAVFFCLTSVACLEADIASEAEILANASQAQPMVENWQTADQSFDRNEWKHLEYLNFNADYPFAAEIPIAGIGIVTITGLSDVQDKNLTVYDDKGRKLATVKCSQENVVTKFQGKTYDRHSIVNPLSPRLFIASPDYFRLAFDCLSSDKKYYKVVINHKTGETGKIRKNDP